MNKTFTITCIKKENGVINSIGVKTDNNQDAHLIKKQDFINEVRELEKKGNIVIIKTTLLSKVIIVDNTYLRTDGNHNIKDDLLDLDECIMQKKS